MAVDLYKVAFVQGERVEVALTNVRFRCTGPCGQWKPGAAFGLRQMDRRNGEIRNQPQCRKCRRRYRKK